MQYLIFDATPISKPLSYAAPFSDTFVWPRLIHLSWIVLDDQLKPLSDHDYLVAPEGFTMDDTIAAFAQLEADEVKENGQPLAEVLQAFDNSLKQADYVFAHNMNASEKIVGAEFLRAGIEGHLFKTERYCLMQEGTYFCKLPSKTGGYKWPSLKELHIRCFNSSYRPVNNAKADVIAATRSFIYLMKKGELQDLFDDD